MSSQLGAGTIVELWLPVVKAAEGGQARSLPVLNHETRRLCVLLVDDDTLVLESTVDMLEDLGHRVHVDSSGAAALDTVRSNPTIDLVITDHAMPGMTGMELAKRIRQVRPDMQVIIATGYADVAASSDLGILRLSKPYRQAELKGLLATLGARSPAPNVIAFGAAKRA